MDSTALYLIIGVAIRGLYDAGESPESIVHTVQITLDQCLQADPAVTAAAQAFAKTVVDRLGCDA